MILATNTRWVHATSRDTTASLVTLWQLLIDVSGWQKWDASLESVAAHGPFDPGTEITRKPQGQEPLTSVLIDVSRGESFTDETHCGDHVVRVTRQLERISRRVIRVTFAVEAIGPGCDELGPAVAADFSAALSSLVGLAEAES